MKKNNKIKKELKNIDIVSIIFLLIAVFTVVYYMLGPSEGYLHSDCVDTMTWAWASVESGKLFSESFCYPYLLPFGGTFFVYPFVKLFGFTMFAYRFSMLMFTAALAAAVYFTARGMQWSRNTAFFAVGLELIILSSSNKLRELFWEHIIHYSLGALLAFVLLALTLVLIKRCEYKGFNIKGDKRLIALSVLVFLWSFFSTFNGVTTLALSTIPVVGALFIEVLIDTERKIFSKENRGIFIAFIIIIVSTLLGAVLFKALSEGIETGYGNASSVISDSSEWSGNLMKFLQHWSSLLGADYKAGKSITDKENIFAAIKLAGSLLIFLVPVYALFIYNKFNRYEKIFLLFHWLMTAFVLYGYVLGNLSSVNWRLSPIIPSALMVNVCVWKTLFQDVSLKRFSFLLSALVICSGLVTVGQILNMPSDYGRDNDHHKAIELLEKNGLNYGYATYWNANILTLLSSSSVEVRDVNVDLEYPRKGWLNTDNLWYEDQPNQDRYFFLLSNSEYDDLTERNHVVLEDTIGVIREGNWVILVKDRNLNWRQ